MHSSEYFSIKPGLSVCGATNGYNGTCFTNSECNAKVREESLEQVQKINQLLHYLLFRIDNHIDFLIKFETVKGGVPYAYVYMAITKVKKLGRNTATLNWKTMGPTPHSQSIAANVFLYF